ncbi:hypothetical protein PM082_023922 [Marasmius tenuissimus]|nr:hypothetical protein PM082_023922 [Marasmius tenuissimus]
MSSCDDAHNSVTSISGQPDESLSGSRHANAEIGESSTGINRMSSGSGVALGSPSLSVDPSGYSASSVPNLASPSVGVDSAPVSARTTASSVSKTTKPAPTLQQPTSASVSSVFLSTSGRTECTPTGTTVTPHVDLTSLSSYTTTPASSSSSLSTNTLTNVRHAPTPSRGRKIFPNKCILPGDGDTDNDCGICHEPLFDGTSFDKFDIDYDVKVLEEALNLIWCKKCWKSLHRGCWDEWLNSCTGTRGRTCPLCRASVE